jgi:signal transduction histidine kinase
LIGRRTATEPLSYVLEPFRERELHVAIEMAIARHEADRKLERWFATTLASIGDAVIATDRDGTVTFRASPGVVSDRGRLGQGLYNYLSNALKFTDDGGLVTVRARRDGESRFRVEVEDTGGGIRPEDLGRLFTAFQQLDSSPGTRRPGTGLLPPTMQAQPPPSGHAGD